MTRLRPLGAEVSAAAPWRPADAAWAVGLGLIGVCVIALGWFGAAGTARLPSQYGWSAMSIVGLLVAGFGNGVWLLAGRRAVGMRRRRLLEDAVGTRHARVFAGGSVPSLLDGSAPADGHVVAELDLVIGVGMTRCHRVDCMLVRGKAVHRYDPATNGQVRHCGICQP